MTTVLDEKTIEILARVYGGLELTWVDDDVACAVTVGDLCTTWTAAHETIKELLGKIDRAERHMVASVEGAVRDRAERDRAVTILNAVLAVATARRAIYEYLPVEVREALDKLIPPCGESYEEAWLQQGYRADWSEISPRAYEIRRVGCCPGYNYCLARLRTVQEVDEWIADHPIAKET